MASVFVIVLDTLRTDSFLATTDRIPMLPGMQRLLSDSVVFQNGYAPSSWTRTSVATLLTGLPPHAHRVYGRLHKLDDGAIKNPVLSMHAGRQTRSSQRRRCVSASALRAPRMTSSRQSWRSPPWLVASSTLSNSAA